MTNVEKAQSFMKEFSIYHLDNDRKEKFLLEVHSIKSDADLEKYDVFLKQLPENPFITKELLPRKTDQKSGYFTLHNDKNNLLILLPFISRKIYWEDKETGYYDIISPYGFVGPIINREIDEKTMKLFWNLVDEWHLNNNVVSEFIRFNFNCNYLGYTGSVVPTLQMVCGNILTEFEQWINFKPKVRNNVRKALSYGLKGIVFHKNISKKNIIEFYDIYSKTMNRLNAKSSYRYSLDFFKNYILNNPNSCSLALVYKENLAISAELLLLSGKVVYSFLGGTDETYFYARPNDLLKLEVINWSRKSGYEYYFLGGGKEERDNLYNYKKRFFPKDRDLTFYTGRKILNKEIYNNLAQTQNTPNTQNPCAKEFFPLYRYLESE
ncbi:GNAT family N-acetyltransferase [Maribacter polysaccharolyticus]|uniref:GNAT family N-acetyltransferase n=1 Tax=Maribacter polysaccharolyticus TaxID=3020831 RepID=UPI00237FAB8B|nr:GNAT family N-acetyltransferase [Maribacter polysaccharolyticus]MDE3743528.1 GNAT family N-acetyltransferase [Maribacter polysaccharolyticus]